MKDLKPLLPALLKIQVLFGLGISVRTKLKGSEILRGGYDSLRGRILNCRMNYMKLMNYFSTKVSQFQKKKKNALQTISNTLL